MLFHVSYCPALRFQFMMRTILQNTDETNICKTSYNHIWSAYPEYDLFVALIFIMLKSTKHIWETHLLLELQKGNASDQHSML